MTDDIIPSDDIDKGDGRVSISEIFHLDFEALIALIVYKFPYIDREKVFESLHNRTDIYNNKVAVMAESERNLRKSEHRTELKVYDQLVKAKSLAKELYDVEHPIKKQIDMAESSLWLSTELNKRWFSESSRGGKKWTAQMIAEFLADVYQMATRKSPGKGVRNEYDREYSSPYIRLVETAFELLGIDASAENAGKNAIESLKVEK